MTELLLFLLPVSFVVGWVLSRHSKQATLENCNDLKPAYFRGLNLLLNEQPDKAIDVFIQLLDVDSDTVETHLALGSLFRRRGEVERAIRIHQNLIARPTLSREQRGEALLHLGLDYMRAGLFDRAENLFEELCELNLHSQSALKNMLLIYQQEKDWQKCLETVGKLESLTKKTKLTEKVNYYCELAEEALQNNHVANATEYLKKAQQINKTSSRARLILAKMAMAREDWKAAIKLFQLVQRDNTNSIPIMLDDLVYCYQRAGKAEDIRGQLESIVSTQANAIVVLKTADLIRDNSGEQAMVSFLNTQLEKQPQPEVLNRLVQVIKPELRDAEQQVMVTAINKITHRLSEIESGYQCSNCGYQAKAHQWQCPGCKSWETFKAANEDT